MVRVHPTGSALENLNSSSLRVTLPASSPLSWGAARRKHLDASSSVITAKVGIGPTGRGGFALEVELHIELPGVERSVGEELIAIADSTCPYSNAIRGNIPVKLVLEKLSPTKE